MRMKRHLPLLISAALYGIALLLPAFRLEEGNSGFLLGFVCLFFGFGHLAWYANPLYFGSLVTLLLKRGFLSALLTLPAIALALTALRITEMPRNEAGHMSAVAGMGAGFHLWLASMVVALFGGILEIRKRARPDAAPPRLS